MAPAWEEAAAEYASSSTVLFAEVDCTTTSGQTLCEHHGVEGFPTLKYVQAGDDELHEPKLEGYHVLQLKEFAASTLKPACSPSQLSSCSEDEHSKLDQFQSMSKPEMENMLQELREPLESAKRKLKKLQHELDELEEMVEESEEEVENRAPRTDRHPLSCSNLQLGLALSTSLLP